MLIGVSSGLSANEISNLTVKNFKDGYDPNIGVTTLKIRRAKVQTDFITFLTPEASNAVLDYLKYRSREPKFNNKQKLKVYEKQKINSDNNYLLITRTVPAEYLINKDEELRKLTPSAIIKIYRNLSESVKKNTPEGDWNVIRSHGMRKWFNSTLLNAGADSFFTEFLMGHTLDSTRSAYFRASPEKLKEIYKKYMSFLTIQEEIDIESNPEVIRLRKENETFSRITALATVENTKYKTLESKYETLEMKIKELQDFEKEREEKENLRKKWDKIIGIDIDQDLDEFKKDHDEHDIKMKTEPEYAKEFNEYFQTKIYKTFAIPGHIDTNYEIMINNRREKEAAEKAEYDNKVKELLGKVKKFDQ